MKIIAYGSLMNQKSLENTLQRSVELNVITVPNVQRIFNAPFDNYAFLNIENVKGVSIEAAYFELKPNETKKFTEREEGSEIIEVLPGYFAFVWPKAYSQELPVLQSYIDICLAGCRELNIDLWGGTKVPQAIVDDTSNPLYK